MLPLIMLVVAFIFFLLATFSVPVPRLNLEAAGLVFLTLALIFSRPGVT